MVPNHAESEIGDFNLSFSRNDKVAGRTILRTWPQNPATSPGVPATPCGLEGFSLPMGMSIYVFFVLFYLFLSALAAKNRTGGYIEMWTSHYAGKSFRGFLFPSHFFHLRLGLDYVRL